MKSLHLSRPLAREIVGFPRKPEAHSVKCFVKGLSWCVTQAFAIMLQAGAQSTSQEGIEPAKPTKTIVSLRVWIDQLILFAAYALGSFCCFFLPDDTTGLPCHTLGLWLAKQQGWGHL